MRPSPSRKKTLSGSRPGKRLRGVAGWARSAHTFLGSVGQGLEVGSSFPFNNQTHRSATLALIAISQVQTMHSIFRVKVVRRIGPASLPSAADGRQLRQQGILPPHHVPSWHYGSRKVGTWMGELIRPSIVVTFHE